MNIYVGLCIHQYQATFSLSIGSKIVDLESLNELEWNNAPHFALLHTMRQLSEPNCVKFTEARVPSANVCIVTDATNY